MDITEFASSIVKGGIIVGGTVYITFWFLGYLVNSSFSMFEHIIKK